MTVLAGGELFTGNTAFLTLALVEKKASLKDLVKNWTWTYFGNFLGAFLIAYMACISGTLGGASDVVAATMAKCSLPFTTLFVKGILCNWLVSMAVYTATGASTLPGKLMLYSR